MEDSNKSRQLRSPLIRALTEFDGNPIHIPEPEIASKRSIVSRFNRKYGTKFVVRKIDEFQAIITIPLKDRESITMDEFNTYSDELDAKIKTLEDRILQINEERAKMYQKVHDKPEPIAHTDEVMDFEFDEEYSFDEDEELM